MKEHVIEAFMEQDVESVPKIKDLLDEATADILSKKQVRALEIAWRAKMIKSGAICRCGRADMLTIDHVVPRVILIEMGFNAEYQWMPENFEVMCRPCNALKSGHLDFSNPKTKKIFTQLLKNL